MVLTREVLEKYMNLEREINRLNRKLNYYSRNPITSQHGVVNGSMSGFPYAQCHFVVGAPDIKSTVSRMEKVQNLIIEIGEKKTKYEDMQLEIDIAIESISDAVIRQIIQLKYVERWTDEEIGNELGFERSTISKKLDKYLDSIDTLSQISHS